MDGLPHRFERYVAIGDSSTEGIDDPDGHGGYRGWANRLAEKMADAQGSLLYANLAIRGRTTRQIREQQLEPALAMKPDLATVFAGTNDVLGPRFDADRVALDMEAMQRALIEGGARVLTFTLPDLTPIMPMARWIAPRVHALNQALRGASASSGATLLDFAAYPVGSDARLWSGDRIHANAAGHARIAEALADALGLPGADASWKRPLPPAARRTGWERVTAEIDWMRLHLLPWSRRGLGARAPEGPRVAKRPNLLPMPPSAARSPAAGG